MWTLYPFAMFSVLSIISATNQFIAKSLGSNMVLQQNSDTALYGYSKEATSTVSIQFNGEIYRTSSSESLATDGGYFWKVTLPPMKGDFTKYTFNITSSAGEVAFIDNVVFGDVFMCSGQSNMQMGVPEMFDAKKEIVQARNYPFIRLISVLQDSCMPQYSSPIDDLYTVFQPWSEGSSANINHSWEISGLCWMYGKHLFDDILHQSYPVGLVLSNWGGTTVQAWSPQSVMDKCLGTVLHPSQQHENPDTFDNTKDHNDKESLKDCTLNPNANAVLYNTFIYPFRHMPLKGALWYQGEEIKHEVNYIVVINVDHVTSRSSGHITYWTPLGYGGIAHICTRNSIVLIGETDSYQPQNYACLQDGMVSAWRELWGDSFPFMFTQLSTWQNYGQIPTFRAAQESILDLTPKTAMITAADLGDPYSTSGEIHPRNKTELGRRMALAASSVIYGKPVAHMGPSISSVAMLADPTYGYIARVTFASESVGEGGLNLQAAQLCPEWSAEVPGGCGYVRLSNSDYDVVCTIVLSGSNSVDVIPSSGSFLSSAPTRVSYGQGDYPLMTVYNDVGAPLLPFVHDV